MSTFLVRQAADNSRRGDERMLPLVVHAQSGVKRHSYYKERGQLRSSTTLDHF